MLRTERIVFCICMCTVVCAKIPFTWGSYRTGTNWLICNAIGLAGFYEITLIAFFFENVKKYKIHDETFKIELYFDFCKSSMDWQWKWGKQSSATKQLLETLFLAIKMYTDFTTDVIWMNTMCAVSLLNHLRAVADAFRPSRTHQRYWTNDRWTSQKWGSSNR